MTGLAPALPPQPEEDWRAERYIDLDAERERFWRVYLSSADALKEAQREFDTRRYLTKSEFLLTKQEAGQIIGVSAKTIERAIQRGEITAYVLFGRPRIKRQDLDAYIESKRYEPSVHDI